MRYNLKLLFSPMKWLCCLLFGAIIPIAMYAPTYFDFTNVNIIYMPFVAVVLLTDIVVIDKNNNFEEIAYLSYRNPVKNFLERYLIVVILLLAFILINNSIFRVCQIINNDLKYEPISLLNFILFVCGSSLMLGSLSMSVTNILNNPYMGYGVALLYWLFWNINCQKQTVFNLFPFIANPVFYKKFLVTEYGFIVILIILNCLLVNKSPFFFADKIRRGIIN